MSEMTVDEGVAEKFGIRSELFEGLFANADGPGMVLIVGCKEHRFSAQALISIQSDSLKTNQKVCGLYLGMMLRKLKAEAGKHGCRHFDKCDASTGYNETGSELAEYRAWIEKHKAHGITRTDGDPKTVPLFCATCNSTVSMPHGL